MNPNQMPEGEVSLRLAFWAIHHGGARGQVEVAIDGAQVQTGDHIHFDPRGFLREHGWNLVGPTTGFGGRFEQVGLDAWLYVHSLPGRGDVVATLASGKTLRAECKKGPLASSKSSKEYPLIREALGQLLTVETVDPDDLLVVAVPHSPKFEALAATWRKAPLVARLGIRIATVHRSGEVLGLESAVGSILASGSSGAGVFRR